MDGLAAQRRQQGGKPDVGYSKIMEKEAEAEEIWITVLQIQGYG